MENGHPFSKKMEALFASLSDEDQRLILETVSAPPPKEILENDPVFWTLVHAFHESAPEPVRSMSLHDFTSTFAVGWAAALGVYGNRAEAS